MDPGTLLDYAVFQLTPTRTRCDLLIFHGGKTEKLASGLFEPFISHLRYAKDEISKGGYSITLRPPTKSDFWFTKSTFERFVRFVSTPEVLERFIRLEKEIVQIETQLQDSELEKASAARQSEQASPSDALVSKTESPSSSTKLDGDVLEGENSRIHLQHVLESRKVLLRKAQAMAYARGRAAGFEVNNINELISFAEAFGAWRLRDACIEFKKLCEKKQADVPWMEEVSAMEAFSSSEQPFPVTSGIFLVNDANALSNESSNMLEHETAGQYSNMDGKKETNVLPQQIPSTQTPMQFPWPNHFPQFMYPVQQIPPYPGFPFPPMQASISENAKDHKVSRKKNEKQSYEEDTESSEETGSELGDSDSENGSGSSVEKKKKHSQKKHKKKSSKTVVIRNINYITSQKKDGEPNGASSGSSTIEDELMDGDSLTTRVMDVVESLRNQKPKLHNLRHGEATETLSFSESRGDDVFIEKRTNANWDAFQNLLMRDEEPKVEDETRRPLAAEIGTSDIRSSSDDASAMVKPKIMDDSLVVTNMHGTGETKVSTLGFDSGDNVRSRLKKTDCADDVLLISNKLEASDINLDAVSDYAAENSSMTLGKSEDYFIPNKSEAIFNGDYISPLKEPMECLSIRRDIPVDDSFMIQDRPQVYDEYDLSRDVSMINEFTLASKAERDSGTLEDKHEVSSFLEPDDLCMVLGKDTDSESVHQSWPGDFAIDVSFIESKRHSSNEIHESANEKADLASKIVSNGKKDVAAGTDVRKGGKSRVVQRPVGNVKTEITSRVKKPSSVSRSTVQKSKLEKEEEMRTKMEEMLIQRQKRIAERTAASGQTPLATKRSPAESKPARASITGDKSKSPSTARAVSRESSNRALRV